jgi:hypothetical protein
MTLLPNTMNQTIPVPHELRHLNGTHAPDMIGTHEAALLLQHWGFARDGRGAVKKLVRCAVLRNHPLKHFTGWRFKTADVLALYNNEHG